MKLSELVEMLDLVQVIRDEIAEANRMVDFGGSPDTMVWKQGRLNHARANLQQLLNTEIGLTNGND